MERTRFGTWKTRKCQIFCMHFQSVPHNHARSITHMKPSWRDLLVTRTPLATHTIKKYVFDNEFHLLLNATNILMHVSLGIITQYLICSIWRTQKVWRYT